jgi:hypothetical protein
MTDIDIDLADRNRALSLVRHVAAAQGHDGCRARHNSGVYFQHIPVDPLDELAAWDYKVAADLGFFKIDFLHNSIYRGVRDEAHLRQLLTTPPPWEAFDEPVVVAALAHIGGHFDIVRSIRPRSVIDLAVCLSLIRPGKRYLIGRSRAMIDREIWQKSTEFYFKKAHAVAYAAAIVVQLNLLVEQASVNGAAA